MQNYKHFKKPELSRYCLFAKIMNIGSGFCKLQRLSSGHFFSDTLCTGLRTVLHKAIQCISIHNTTNPLRTPWLLVMQVITWRLFYETDVGKNQYYMLTISIKCSQKIALYYLVFCHTVKYCITLVSYKLSQSRLV